MKLALEKKAVAFGLFAVVSLALIATAAAARDPRLEKLALRPADTRLAKEAVVQRSDLGSRWAPSVLSSEQRAPDCPGYRPDFSKFTITGQADSAFVLQAGAGLAANLSSHVEIYASKADARGDFALSTAPAAADCLGIMLRRDSMKAAPNIKVKLLSSSRVTAPRVGERAAAFRIVSQLSQSGFSLRAVTDIVVVLRGRSIGGIVISRGLTPVAGVQNAVARMAARLR